MIAEIGIVVALYVVARLLSERAPAVGRIVSVVAVLVATLVALDLGVRAFRDGGIAGLVGSDKDEPTAAGADAGDPDTSTVSRVAGGSITTELGFGIAVAKGSTMQREWIAVHDPSLPATLQGTPGVATAYVRREYSGEYRYRAKFNVTTTAPIRAIQVRFLTFDVWGEHVRTLSFEEVGDVPANATREFDGEWQLFSENDVEKHYASIGYIARIRLADGRVIEARTDKVIEEAQKFSEKFTSAELEPTATPPAGR